MMRIAFAELAQETDSFSPLVTELVDFETYGLYFGDEVLQRMRGVGPLGGFLEIAEQAGESIELRPILRAWAAAGGTIADKSLQRLTDRLTDGLKEAGPLDAVFLSLHGAAASQGEDDVEGHVLQLVRDLIGPDVPIVCPMDHHANITQRMVDLADALIGHETQPHHPLDTGRKAARILFSILRGDVQPAMAWRKITMITPQDQFLTSQGPMKAWFDHARTLEQEPGVIDVSPYPMQPWLDVAEGGWSVVVHTDGNPELADQLAAEMAERAWEQREQFWKSERVAPSEAVHTAFAADGGLIILSDTGDSVYGGAPGDSTCILEELLRHPANGLALVPIVDAEVLEQARQTGVGGRISVQLGGKIDDVFSRPVELTARVAALSEGVTVELEERGACNLGRTALLEANNLRIVVLDHRSFAINHPVLYTHLGLDVADARLVVVKTASNFQFFKRWRDGLIRVDSAGATQSDLAAFHWKRLPRPIYPFDLE